MPDLKELANVRKSVEKKIRVVERDILEPYVGRKCLSISLPENAAGTLETIPEEEVPDNYTKEDLYQMVHQNENRIMLKNKLDEIQLEFSTFFEERDLHDKNYKRQIVGINQESGNDLSDWEIAKFVGCTVGYVRKFTFEPTEEGSVKEQRPPELSIPEELRQEVLERDSSCVRCQTNSNLEVHHIIPVSQGGKPNNENLAVLCQNCHSELHRETHYETRDEFWSCVEDSSPT